jgi:hypothetical protein
MRLPARAVAGVALVLVGFILHTQARRRESSGQLFRDDIGGPHGVGFKPCRRRRSMWNWSVRRASFCFVKLAAPPSASA